MRYLMADIYKNGTDCSNHGISSMYDHVLIPCHNGPFEYAEGEEPANAVRVRRRRVMGRELVEFVPASAGERDWYMWGGTFVYTSDARFDELGFGGPVKLFDRTED